MAQINSSVTSLNNKQITADFFFLNNSSFKITNTEKSFAKFCVKGGNTVDFFMFLTSDDLIDIAISLKKNGSVVAKAPISGTIKHNILVWREKMTANSTFDMTFRRSLKGTTTIS